MKIMLILEFLLICIACTITIPIVVVFVECLAARAPVSCHVTCRATLNDEISVVVLVPAHNEELVVGDALGSVVPQLRSQDRLLVVADNCDDRTAAIARQAGATVVERQDCDRIGKGYALEFGLRQLEKHPPDVVVFMDADCHLEPGGLPQIAALAASLKRPIQALYLFDSPDNPTSKDLISAFAIKVKNWVRPLGLARFGLPSLLFGTGMAFPWTVIRSVDLASSYLVEDMKLGLDLAIAGHTPLFCSDTRVIGQLPANVTTASQQRTRWEHGHLKMLSTYSLRLLVQSLQQRRLDLAALALDLTVPPLSLLSLAWLGYCLITLIIGVLGLGWTHLLIMMIDGLLLSLAIIIAWSRFARHDLPIQKLPSISKYVLWKLPIYMAFWFKPQSNWVKTKRILK